MWNWLFFILGCSLIGCSSDSPPPPECLDEACEVPLPVRFFWVGYLATLGLRNRDGSAKLALERLQMEAEERGY